jgi:cyclopropane fatty-acyl-phospholipid synthase-like methyltransferase
LRISQLTTDRPTWLSVALHENEGKFAEFLISRGNPVLELGCGSGDRLVAFEPSYGVDFCSTTVARAKHAILGSTSYRARSRIPPP